MQTGGFWAQTYGPTWLTAYSANSTGSGRQWRCGFVRTLTATKPHRCLKKAANKGTSRNPNVNTTYLSLLLSQGALEGGETNLPITFSESCLLFCFLLLSGRGELCNYGLLLCAILFSKKKNKATSQSHQFEDVMQSKHTPNPLPCPPRRPRTMQTRVLSLPPRAPKHSSCRDLETVEFNSKQLNK